MSWRRRTSGKEITDAEGSGDGGAEGSGEGGGYGGSDGGGYGGGEGRGDRSPPDGGGRGDGGDGELMVVDVTVAAAAGN